MRSKRSASRAANRGASKSSGRLHIVAPFVGAAATVIAAVLVAWHPWESKVTPVARVTLSKLYGNAIVPKAIDTVPQPPAFPRSQGTDHCAFWWRKWLPRQHAADFEYTPQVAIAAPDGSDVTVTRALVHVFRAYRPRDFSGISCRVSPGAGPEGGTRLILDLDHPTKLPTILPTTGGPEMQMPSGVINIAPGHTEYIELNPLRGEKLYEWSFTLEVSVGQHVEYESFGSRTAPLRTWGGSFPSRLYAFPTGASHWRPVHS